MTTQTMNNFETLDLEALANVEGGKVNWDRLSSSASGALREFISVPHQVLHSLRLHLYAIVGCGVVGAGLGYAFPH
ncbi:MAG: ComC/BlpC family leader-containing pheromone/bacteriocin [Streptococcus salivarius]